MASFMALAGLGTKKKQKTNGVEIVEVQVDLFQPTANKFPRFHLPTLIKEQTGKTFDEDNPLGDNEEYQKLQSIASKFEEKYGPKRDKKGRKIKFGKPEDYMDLGMGYDLEDPFIDDSEGYDELVPSTLTPIHGGFYVNRGPLEFKEVSESDDDDDDDASSNGEPKKKMSRLAVESSDESSKNSVSDQASDAESTTEADPNGTVNGSTSATVPKHSRSTMVGRPPGRPSMTPKQKASANLLERSKGWTKKNKMGVVDGKRRVEPAEKSNSFYGRIDDVVASVMSKAVVPSNDSTNPQISKAADQLQSIINAISKSPDVTPKTQKSPNQKMEIGSGDTPANVKAEPSSSRPSNASSPEITVVQEVAAPATPRLTGKPPTVKLPPAKTVSKTPDAVPKSSEPKFDPKFLKLNEHFVERAKEGGQLSFHVGTDKVLREIMSECDKLGYDESKRNVILDDIASRLRITRARIVARWEKINDPSRWTIPQVFRQLNEELVKRAKAGGQLCFHSGTDEILRKIMADCDKFALNQLQRDMIMDDLAGRLKVKKERILARWEKYKSLTQSSQSILDVSSSSTTSTTSSAPSTKSATSSTSQASTAPKIESVQKQQLLKMANMTCAKLSEMLKEEIDRRMPGLEAEYRKLADEVALKKLEQMNSSSDGEKQKNVYTPRRKYFWTDCSRGVLSVIIGKVVADIEKEECPNTEEALKRYLEMYIVPLWPQGWMNVRELMKEGRDAFIRSKKPFLTIGTESATTFTSAGTAPPDPRPTGVSTVTSVTQSTKPTVSPGVSTVTSAQAKTTMLPPSTAPPVAKATTLSISGGQPSQTSPGTSPASQPSPTALRTSPATSGASAATTPPSLTAQAIKPVQPATANIGTPASSGSTSTSSTPQARPSGTTPTSSTHTDKPASLRTPPSISTSTTVRAPTSTPPASASSQAPTSVTSSQWNKPTATAAPLQSTATSMRVPPAAPTATVASSSQLQSRPSGTTTPSPQMSKPMASPTAMPATAGFRTPSTASSASTASNAQVRPGTTTPSIQKSMNPPTSTASTPRSQPASTGSSTPSSTGSRSSTAISPASASASPASAAVAASAIRLGTPTLQTPMNRPKPTAVPNTSPLTSPPHLGFSIQHLTSSASSSSSSASTAPARTLSSAEQARHRFEKAAALSFTPGGSSGQPTTTNPLPYQPPYPK